MSLWRLHTKAHDSFLLSMKEPVIRGSKPEKADRARIRCIGGNHAEEWTRQMGEDGRYAARMEWAPPPLSVFWLEVTPC